MINEQGAIIYNLFPRLLGAITSWSEHFDRIAKMHFNWLFINPIYYTGFSGSLYSIKDYRRLNPLFLDTKSALKEEEQIKTMLEKAKSKGLSVMLDFVINHTAIDHPFTSSHKNWYKLNKGKIVNPGAFDNGKWVEWGDLAEVDNEASADKDNLWNYWLFLALYYLSLGFDGLRCDAAYKVPCAFWKFLINRCKENYPNSRWFAESLGCPIEETINLGTAGFDYTFNSSKWWDFEADWCLSQHNENNQFSRSVSFAESHDTDRLSSGQHLGIVKQKYFLSAIFSSAVMIPIGYEFGFKKKLDVVNTTKEDYEKPYYDISPFIKNINAIKRKIKLLNEEGNISTVHNIENKHCAVLLKTSLYDKNSKALIIINKDQYHKQILNLNDIALPKIRKSISSVSLENNRQISDTITLEPCEIILLCS